MGKKRRCSIWTLSQMKRDWRCWRWSTQTYKQRTACSRQARREVGPTGHNSHKGIFISREWWLIRPSEGCGGGCTVIVSHFSKCDALVFPRQQCLRQGYLVVVYIRRDGLRNIWYFTKSAGLFWTSTWFKGSGEPSG